MSDSRNAASPPALCLAPFASGSAEPARFDVPAGACDTHAHVISPDSDRYPFVRERSYTPPPAPESAYLEMLNNLGISRGVLVQISMYGADNRYMLEVLERHRDRLRGVAVVDTDIGDAELERMHATGVRGLRVNVLSRGGPGFAAMESLAARIAPLGWHMQFLMDVRDLPDLVPRMRKLPCPVVLDHMGHMPVALGTSHAGFQAMLHMVREHGWWTKLSGAYRISDRFDDAFNDVVPWAHALVEAAPERMI